jgi:O-antigen biosynthesis protein
MDSVLRRVAEDVTMRKSLGAGSLIPWQQLERVPEAAPGTWRSCGVEPQFRLPCRLSPGWVRIRFRMDSPARARAEIGVDTGAGLDAAEWVERISFRGTVERDFFINLPRPVYGIRLDPLDMEGAFRLERFEVRPVSRLALLGHALQSAFTQSRGDWQSLGAVGHGMASLLRGRAGQIKKWLLGHVTGHSALAPPPQDAEQAFASWRQRRALTDADRQRLRAEGGAMTAPPLLSIVLPVAEGPPAALRQAIDSIERQTYPHWELCLADIRTPTPAVRRLLEAFTQRDRRIKFGTQTAGDYVMFLDAGDELAEHALSLLARAIGGDGHADMLYSDEDQIEPDGRHVCPFFKPDWSPEYLLSYMYTGRLAAYRTTLVRELDGIHAAAPALDYDLALRFAARSARVRHIPDVLYHRRHVLPPEAAEAGRRAVARFLEATGRAGVVEPGPAPCVHQVRLAIAGRPLVSIILPTAYRELTVRGETTTYVTRCLASICAKSTYSNYEIVILDDADMPAALQGDLARWGVSRTAYPQPFNWAAAMNRGAALARGTHLLFLDDDTEVQTPDWLERLLEYSQQPAIGVVGARLHFPDGRLQHAGVTVLDGTPGHPFYGQPGNHSGYFYSNVVPRNYSAVTGACLMTRAEVFHELGGFNETFAVNFNDIDYCLRVRDSGRRIVCNPHARLMHYETATKAAYFHTELNTFKERWGERGAADPFYNPNLSTRFHDFRVEVV